MTVAEAVAAIVAEAWVVAVAVATVERLGIAVAETVTKTMAGAVATIERREARDSSGRGSGRNSDRQWR